MIRCVANPLLLFLAVWGTAVALYLGGVCAGTFPSPHAVLWVAVLLNVGGFSLGYLTWSAFRPLTDRLGSAPPEADGGLKPVSHAPSGAKVLTLEAISRALRFTGLMGLMALSLGLCRIAAIASGLGVSFRDLLNDPGLLRLGFVNFTTAGIVEASWMVMLISITSSLFSIGFILLGVLLHAGAGKARYFYLCAFLLISLAIGLTSVSRYETTVNILYLLFAYCFVRSSFVVRRASCVAQSAACRGGARHSRVHNPRAVFGVLLAVAVIAMLFLAVDALLRKSAEYEQPDRLRGFLFHLYWYMASPLAAFNEFLAGFDGRYHLGQYTFFPLYKWLFRFHLVPQTNVSVFGEFVFVPYVANVYTWLRNFYEDFGLIGVTAVPYALGWAASALRTRAARHFHYLNLYMVLLVFVLFSFYNYFLFSNQVYLQVLFGFLFFRYELPGYNRPDVVEAAGREQKDVLITGIPNE